MQLFLPFLHLYIFKLTPLDSLSLVELNHCSSPVMFLFSLTPKWFSTDFLDQHFIPLCCSDPFVKGQGWGWSASSTIPHSGEVAKAESIIDGLSFKNHFPLLRTWVSSGSPLERKVLMDSAHFRPLHTDEPELESGGWHIEECTQPYTLSCTHTHTHTHKPYTHTHTHKQIGVPLN